MGKVAESIDRQIDELKKRDLSPKAIIMDISTYEDFVNEQGCSLTFPMKLIADYEMLPIYITDEDSFLEVVSTLHSKVMKHINLRKCEEAYNVAEQATTI